MPASGLKGDLGTLRALKKKISSLPTTAGHAIAQAAAPAMTTRTRRAYASGQTVFDESRPLGKVGNHLDLRESGKTERQLRFVATGTILRCVLGTPYARYLIGKYKILPIATIPIAWIDDLSEITSREIKAALE